MPPATAGTYCSVPTHSLTARLFGRDAEQLRERRPHDERQHQQLVGVEREAERGDAADQPLQRRQSARRVASVV